MVRASQTVVLSLGVCLLRASGLKKSTKRLLHIYDIIHDLVNVMLV